MIIILAMPANTETPLMRFAVDLFYNTLYNKCTTT